MMKTEAIVAGWLGKSEESKAIMLANGSKKVIHEKWKSLTSEASFKIPVLVKLEDGKRSHREPLSNDINKKSNAFIQSRLTKMRKNL
ncbi:hypothetical protein F2Q69_00062530 [Brassica cretica]|uniref:Uncharacterized protein n=1 Tax=Brassica cretica TaxID=69181 RepID=A0A8S9RD20_BRACR|nr:hypothetical protein F2Q69_00062530 [Brassica cretica]